MAGRAFSARRWGLLALDVSDRAMEGLEHWCEYVDDDPLACYASHQGMDPFNIILLYADPSEDELRELRSMPSGIYKKYVERRIERFIESKVREWEKKWREWGEE
ncbi:MAG: hypothetical protein QXW41_07460 [Fervidicoccaceae archaeon]